MPGGAEVYGGGLHPATKFTNREKFPLTGIVFMDIR